MGLSICVYNKILQYTLSLPLQQFKASVKIIATSKAYYTYNNNNNINLFLDKTVYLCYSKERKQKSLLYIICLLISKGLPLHIPRISVLRCSGPCAPSNCFDVIRPSLM